MKYVLDTNTCIYIMKVKPQGVLTHFKRVSKSSICISIITHAELLYGLNKSKQKSKNKQVLDDFVKHLDVLDWGSKAAEHYAVIRAHLEKKGTIIGNMGLMIAAHTRSIGGTVITNNEKEFKRVPNLKVENWLK